MAASINNLLSKKLDVIIVHVTDTYFIEEIIVNGKVDIPGFSRIHSFLNWLRENSDAAKQTPVLVVHGGDFLFPSLMSNYFDGNQMVDVLNKCGFDYCTLGNHDFDGGHDILTNCLSKLNCDVLCANLKDSQNEKISPYQLWPKDKKEPTMAIVGISGKDTIRKAEQNGFDTLSINSALEKTLRELQEKFPSVTNLVVLSHMGNAEDSELKHWLDDNWNGYTYILGGHDHNKIFQHEVETNPRSLLMKGQSNCRTVQIIGIPTSSQDHKRNNNKTKTSKTVHSLPDYVYFMESDELANFAPSIDIQKIVTKWQQLLEKETNELKLDRTVKQFEGSIIFDATELSLRKGSTNFGNFVTDCVLKFTSSDIVMMNSGHFRGDRRVGNILKLSDLKRIFVLPTKNRIIKTKMTGVECKEFLKHAYREEGRGRILQISKNAIELLDQSKDDKEFFVTMLYDMIKEEEDGFADILANLRNVSIEFLHNSLHKDILVDSDLLDMIIHSSPHVKYDPSTRLSVDNFSEKL